MPSYSDKTVDFFINHGWFFVWVVFFATIAYALHEHAEHLEKVRESKGSKKALAASKLVLLWAMPILALFGAIASQLWADRADRELTQSHRDLTNEISASGDLSNRLKQTAAALSETRSNLDAVRKTATEAREMAGSSNSTAILNETKTTLAEANNVATDVKSVLLNSNLASIKITSADRTITPEEENKIIASLKPFIIANALETNKVKILAQYTDSEAHKYAQKIAEVLTSRGCNASFGANRFMMGNDIPESGLISEAKSPPSLLSIAILKSFRDANVNPDSVFQTDHMTGLSNWENSQYELLIFVAHKP
jgi:hypothetical protein